MATYNLRPFTGSSVALELARRLHGLSSPCTLIVRDDKQADLVERVVSRMRERGLTESRVIVDINPQEREV